MRVLEDVMLWEKVLLAFFLLLFSGRRALWAPRNHVFMHFLHGVSEESIENDGQQENEQPPRAMGFHEKQCNGEHEQDGDSKEVLFHTPLVFPGVKKTQACEKSPIFNRWKRVILTNFLANKALHEPEIKDKVFIGELGPFRHENRSQYVPKRNRCANAGTQRVA